VELPDTTNKWYLQTLVTFINCKCDLWKLTKSKSEEDSIPHVKVETIQKYPITIAILFILGSPLINMKPVSYTETLVGRGIVHVQLA